MARVSGRRSFLRSVADHNPFYLLSAASMLLACLLLSNTTSWSPIAVRKLITLIITLNVYELLLVAFGLYLIVKRKLRGDGTMLLFLEALFLVDVGFLNSEVYQESLQIGLIVNAILLLLAIGKLAVIFRFLGLRLVSPAFGLLLLTIGALMAQPALLKEISQEHQGRVSELALYAEWWIGSCLAAGFAFVRCERSADQRAAETPLILVRFLYRTFAVLALLSIIAHLGTSHWVYKTTFSSPDLSPMFLAMAVLLTAAAGNAFIGKNEIPILYGVLPVAAVLTSLGGEGSALVIRFGSIHLAPWTLTFAAAYLTIAFCFFARHFLKFVFVGAGIALVYVLGPTAETVGNWIERFIRWINETVRRLAPDSQVAWGFITLAGAFVLFGIGAAFSLFKANDTDDRGDAGQPQPPEPSAPDAPVIIAPFIFNDQGST